MIQSINNINFKAIRLVKQSKFSESQKNIANDMSEVLKNWTVEKMTYAE